MTRIAITGGNGFVGGHLAERLLETRNAALKREAESAPARQGGAAGRRGVTYRMNRFRRCVGS